MRLPAMGIALFTVAVVSAACGGGAIGDENPEWLGRREQLG